MQTGPGDALEGMVGPARLGSDLRRGLHVVRPLEIRGDYSDILGNGEESRLDLLVRPTEEQSLGRSLLISLRVVDGILRGNQLLNFYTTNLLYGMFIRV